MDSHAESDPVAKSVLDTHVVDSMVGRKRIGSGRGQFEIVVGIDDARAQVAGQLIGAPIEKYFDRCNCRVDVTIGKQSGRDIAVFVIHSRPYYDRMLHEHLIFERHFRSGGNDGVRPVDTDRKMQIGWRQRILCLGIERIKRQRQQGSQYQGKHLNSIEIGSLYSI